MSSRCLFRVSEVFTIRGRGTVLLPGIVAEGGERFAVGDSVELRLPDGRRATVAIAGIELFNSGDAVPVLVKLAKEDVPVGSEVWSVPVEGRAGVERRRAAGRGGSRGLKAALVVVVYEVMVCVMLGASVWIYVRSPEARGDAGFFVLLSASAALLPLHSLWRGWREGRVKNQRGV